ncbi:MAG: hypothetical protein AAF721_06470 [Myxococcota bacterium]
MNFVAIAFAAVVAIAPESAEEHAALAEQHYVDGFYAEASSAYAAAFSLDEDPVYLYGWAQSERRAGNCPRAVELYRQYAAMDVSEVAREAASKNAQRCGATLTPAPTPTPEPAPEVDEPEDTPPAESPEAQPFRDVPTITLLATGGAVGAVALVVGLSSRQQRRLSQEAEVEADYATRIERSDRLRSAAIVTASVAGAAVIGAVVRYLVVTRRGRSSRSSARRPFSVRF